MIAEAAGPVTAPPHRIDAIAVAGVMGTIAAALAAYTGGTAGVSIMLILLALITLAATLCARETKNDRLIAG